MNRRNSLAWIEKRSMDSVGDSSRFRAHVAVEARLPGSGKAGITEMSRTVAESERTNEPSPSSGDCGPQGAAITDFD
jgi:hypothetical protein